MIITLDLETPFETERKLSRWPTLYSGLCDWCGNWFYTLDHPQYKGPFCSPSCNTKHRNTGKFGKDHPAYKGIPTEDKDGYLRLHCPIRKRFVGVHRLVMEQKIGRLLTSQEAVHHKDHNRKNNDISNLEIIDHAEHTRQHRLGNI